MTSVRNRKPSYGPRAIWSWAFYDFANSSFTTLVITFVYATYFTQVIAPDPITGTALWSRAIAITALVTAVCSPLLGALADRGGYRKTFVLLFSLICVLATAALYQVLPGQIGAALAIVVVANLGYEFATVFYNAFLPDISPPGRIGRVSGYGWALGYVGGLLALLLALVALVQPETPWFGFSTEAGENIRATNLLTALWFALFTLPFLLWVPEDRSATSDRGRVIGDAMRQLRGTFAEIRYHGQDEVSAIIDYLEREDIIESASPDDYLVLSGTNLRALLTRGIHPPPELTRPEVAAILMEYYKQQAPVKLCSYVHRGEASYGVFTDSGIIFQGKNFWRSGALGPCMVTCDAAPPWPETRLETRLNGMTMQSATIKAGSRGNFRSALGALSASRMGNTSGNGPGRG